MITEALILSAILFVIGTFGVLVRASADNGTASACARWSSVSVTFANMPGMNAPSGFSTSICTSIERVAESTSPATRATVLVNSRFNSGTLMTTD